MRAYGHIYVLQDGGWIYTPDVGQNAGQPNVVTGTVPPALLARLRATDTAGAHGRDVTYTHYIDDHRSGTRHPPAILDLESYVHEQRQRLEWPRDGRAKIGITGESKEGHH